MTFIRKTLRKSFYIVVLVLIVCVIAITAVVTFIDPNRVKPVIISEVLKNTGYKLTIDGRLSWSLYPRLGIKVDQMTLTAPDQTEPFIIMKDITMAAELLQLLRGYQTLQGDLHITNLTLMNVQAQNTKVTLQWQNNILTLSPMSLSLYGGTMDGVVHARDLSGNPHWDWNVQFTQINLQPLLHDINGENTKLNLAGTGQVKLQGEAQGRSKQEIIRSTNGSGEFSLTKGSVDGIDLNYLMQSADAVLNKKDLAEPTHPGQTEFESLTGKFVIKNGIASTHNLILVSSTFVTKGDGSIDLSNNTLDFQLDVSPQKLEKLKWTIPVLVSGDLYSPSVRLDTLKLNAIVASEQFEKVKIKVQEEIKKLPGQVDSFLQKVMGK